MVVNMYYVFRYENVKVSDITDDALNCNLKDDFSFQIIVPKMSCIFTHSPVLEFVRSC